MERLRVTKTSLEVTNEKLEAELEETRQRLLAALSRPLTEGADAKAPKASVVTRSAGWLFVPLHLEIATFSDCPTNSSFDPCLD